MKSLEVKIVWIMVSQSIVFSADVLYIAALIRQLLLSASHNMALFTQASLLSRKQLEIGNYMMWQRTQR